MDTVLKTTELTKVFSGKKAVDHVSMTVNRGDIYGFIGKNGAGKTTLIRMAVGLAAPSGGSIELFGSKDLTQMRKKVGTVIEYPAVIPHMTARQNLVAQCKLQGVKDLSVIDRILSTVGLESTGKKKAKNFSLGMKQRLAIAIALIGEPDFLFLDEPTNGLDPTGIKEIRELIQKLNHEHGITVLISSHILGELSKLATRYGIIDKGVMIDEFTAEDLEARCKSSLMIQVDRIPEACSILENVVGTKNYTVNPDGTISLFDHLDEAGLPIQINLSQIGSLVAGEALRYQAFLIHLNPVIIHVQGAFIRHSGNHIVFSVIFAGAGAVVNQGHQSQMVRLAAGKLEDKGINVEFLLYLSQSVHKFIPGFGRLGVANLGKHVGTVVQHIDAYHVRQLNQLAFISSGFPNSLAEFRSEFLISVQIIHVVNFSHTGKGFSGAVTSGENIRGGAAVDSGQMNLIEVIPRQVHIFDFPIQLVGKFAVNGREHFFHSGNIGVRAAPGHIPKEDVALFGSPLRGFLLTRFFRRGRISCGLRAVGGSLITSRRENHHTSKQSRKNRFCFLVCVHSFPS